jgi:hypothetical protein
MKVRQLRRPSAHSRKIALAAAASVLPLMIAPASASSAQTAPAAAGSAPIATPPSNCSSTFDPYNYTQAAVAACGYPVSPQTALNAMPGGGTSYDYSLDGSTVRFYVPPAGFDPATASAAQLDEYGFPPRPTDPGALSQWQTEMNNWKGTTPPPPFLTETSAQNDTVYNDHWSGYVVTEAAGTFTHAEAWFIEPTFGSSRCSTNAESTWAGIGGWTTGRLAQDGTAHNEAGIGNHQAWWEILPGDAVPVNLYGHPGVLFDTSVRRITNGFRFYMYDYYSATTKAFDETGGANNSYDGSSAEAIAERPSNNGTVQNLSNFGTLTFSETLANENGFDTYNPTGHRHGVHMNNGDDLADPSGIGSSGYFTVAQHNCN